MAKINDIIEQAYFQVIEMQIASILQSEFVGQNTLRDDSFYPTTISYGRYGAVNEGQLPYVCVNWMGDKSVLESRQELQGTDSYFIDVKTEDRETTAQMLNAIKHILKDNHYYDLGLPSGMISRATVESMGIDFENQTVGADGTASGGVNFSVDINEGMNLLDDGVLITELQTNANIGNKTIQFINTL